MKNRLRELRKEKKLTLLSASKMLQSKVNLDVTPDSLSKYERGDREPKLSIWNKLSLFYDVPISYLQGVNDIRYPKDLKELLSNSKFDNMSQEYSKDDLQDIADNLDADVNNRYLNVFNYLNNAFLISPNIGRYSKQKYSEIIDNLKYPKDKDIIFSVDRYFVIFYELLLINFSKNNDDLRTKKLISLLDDFHTDEFNKYLNNI